MTVHPVSVRSISSVGLLGTDGHGNDPSTCSPAQCTRLSMVRHEVATPLTAMRAALDLLAQESSARQSLTAHELKLLTIARGNAERAIHLLNDLTGTSTLRTSLADTEVAPEADAHTAHSAAVALRTAAFTLAGQARAAGVHLVVAPTLSSTSAPTSHLVRVLVNLVTNAIRAAGNGGRVRLTALPCSQDRTELVEFSVSNTGPALDAVTLAGLRRRLTHSEPFAQVRSRDHGLGLAISADVVRRHGGTMSIESSADLTTVSFRLPALPAAAPQVSTNEGASTAAAGEVPRPRLASAQTPVSGEA